MDTIRLGARLRAARKAAGFKTSKAFLKKHKVPASTYSQHESGARIPDDETLRFYSKVFDVNFDWLTQGKGSPFSKLSIPKKNIMEEELLDLSNFKKDKKPSLIDQGLLVAILHEIISYNQINQPKVLLSTSIKDAVAIYIKTNSAMSNKKVLAKQLIKEYKNRSKKSVR